MIKILAIIVLFSSMLFSKQINKYYEYVQVTHSSPIYNYTYINKPYKECYEETYNNTNYSNNNSIGLDTIIGFAAGAIIGNQVGKGNGRVAAKIVGGLLGGKIANNIRNNNSSNYGAYDDYATRTQCITKYKQKKQKTLSAYKNYFFYNGRQNYKISNRRQNTIKIKHTISY